MQSKAIEQQQNGETNLAGRAGVRWLAAMMALLVLVSAAGFLWVEREQELATAAEHGTRRVEQLADLVQGALAVARVALTRLEVNLNALPPGTSLDEAMQRSMADIRPLLASLPLPLSVQALGADGRAIGPSMLPAGLVLPDLALPDSNGWRAAPTQGAPGQRLVPLVRRATADRHGVAAWLVAFDHAALVHQFDNSRERDGGGAALLRVESDHSLVVLARAPHNDAELGRRVRGPMALALFKASRGHFVAQTQIDQVARVVAYQRLDGDAAELAVGYGMATEAVLAAWHSVLPWAAGIVLLLLAALAFGARRLDRALRTQERQQLVLRQSESHFRALADNVPDVVVRMDRDGRHLYANPAVQQATGLPPEAFIGKTNAELGMPAESVALWMATLRRAFAQRRSERLEFAYPGPRGLRHWESAIAPEPVEAGAPPTALVISRDITERKQAEADRAAMSRRLVDLLETMSDGFVALDRQWRYQVVNRKAGDMLGRDAASLIGKHIWTEFPEGVGQPFHRAYERAMNDGVTVVLDEYYAPWDRWFENRIHPSPDGISIFFTDVTERVRAADALRQSEQRLREAQHLAVIGSWGLDLRSGALQWSDEVFRIFEIDPTRFGASYEAFLAAIHPQDREAVDLAYRRSVDERSDYEITHRLLLGDGRIKHVHEQGRSFYADDGTPVRSVGTIQDVTERVKAEQALRDSERRFRALVELSSDWYWQTDAEHRFVLREGAILARMGIPPAADYGLCRWEMPDFVNMTVSDWAAHRTALDRREEFRNLLLARRSPDGRIHWATISGRPIFDDFGAFVGYHGIGRDITEQVTAARTMRESEERLRLALQAANQGLYDLDLRTGDAVVSPEYTRMLGWEPEEFRETNAFWRERLHPDDRAGVLQVFEDYVAGRRSDYRVEFRQRTKDGGWKWILSQGQIKERDAQGQPVRMLGTHTDITAIKQMQAAQTESEARLKYLLGRAPTVIYTARAEGDYAATYYSPNLADMLGWQPAEFLQDGAFWLDHVHPEDRAAVLGALGALHERDSLVLEYRFQHADGRWRWMRDEVGVERGPDGRPTELVGSWIDITDRREAEDEVRRLAGELEQRVAERTEQLARSEARYRKIFETVPVSIGEEDWSGVQRLLRELRAEGVTDAPGYFATRPDFVRQCLRAVKVQRLNRQALALHDAHDKPAAVTGLESFYPRPEYLSQFVGELEAMWTGQRLFTAKRSLPSVTGRPLRLMLTMSLPGLDDDDGTALVCLVDITELDRLNAELDRSVARLREANRELETFTYSVSHDLKAPLRGIDGYSRLLLTDHREQLDDEGREFLEHIRHATWHMGELIDDLLSYSRLERRELTLARQPLAAAVGVVLSGYRNELAAAGAVLEVHIDPGLGALADAQGLTLALRNLIDNAIKFSRASAPPRIAIEAVRRDGGVELSVRDNGVGFDMKFHDRIFSIFQRLHRSEDFPGTGIGLAIVRKAMERMGGRVQARSRPGEGATFTLHLPEADPT